ncbi:MAG: hypothetical protein IJ482_04915 [Alphaproteobacteria bacterium]|nr:hypothetical protein [Alphaproteobacteria bacterium]
MVRIPTYNSYMNLLNQTLNIKSQIDLYSYQGTTGLKSPTYSGYGISAYNIVNLESALGVAQNFMENNKVLDVELSAMNTAMQSINDAVSDLKSMLNSFGASDADKMNPDQTGGEITFTDNNESAYLGKTITIDGVQYTFADNADEPNNIDLSVIQADSGTEGYAEKVMGLLKDKIDPAGTNSDYVFEGNKFSFPLYTINGSSTVLGADGVELGEAYAMNQDKAAALKDLQNSAFATMLALADSLNTSAGGRYLFGGGNSSNPPVNFPFKTLEEFQEYYDGINIKFPDSASAVLSNMSFTAADTGALEISRIEGNNYKITPEKAGGFLNKVAEGSAQTTGDVTFDSDKNTITATEYHAFQSVKAGDTLVVGRGGDGSDDLSLIVKSVSEDGKTITFEDVDGHNIPASADGTVADGTGLTFSTSFPVGAVIDMSGMGNNVAERVQVVSVNTDGSLNVTADPNHFNADTVQIAASSKWEMSTSSYYQGGTVDTERLISNNQSIIMNVNAGDGAFEKLFRSLGQIAQGNMVDNRDLSQEFDGLVDPNFASDTINNAMDLLQSAIDNSGDLNPSSTSSLDGITAKLSSDYVRLNNNTENLTLASANLETSVSNLKDVDKTEAIVKALMASNSLQASYSMLNNLMNLSLLNYLK